MNCSEIAPAHEAARSSPARAMRTTETSVMADAVAIRCKLEMSGPLVLGDCVHDAGERLC